MTGFFLKNIDLIATMDDSQSEITNGYIITDGHKIQSVGHCDAAPLIEKNTEKAETLDLKNHIVIPGLVNVHHHLYQNMTRVIPAGQNTPLFPWLQSLYPIWQRMKPEHFYVAAAVGLCELALSGCTTTSDHQYIFPNGTKLDDTIQAALDIGLRFVATRGSMSIGETKGGLPPDQLCENETDILKDCERVIGMFHQRQKHAMVQIALAPCSPFSVSQDLMRESAILAEEKQVGLHTHLAENVEDIEYSLANFNMRPGEYIKKLGWVGPHVWHAHCVQLDDHEIKLFADTQTGVAHCPCSNMRLGSGIAPIRKMRAQNVRVGLGVDGSASNDSAHMLCEARQALLLQRVLDGKRLKDQRSDDPSGYMSAREALFIATRGGAEVLNRHDIGQIKSEYSADLVIFDRRSIELAGTQSDPIAGLILCAPVKPRYVIVNGKMIVKDGQMVSINVQNLLEKHHHLATQLFKG
ncbi:MAG: 8-oxoguanine deaminase [Pseudomonadota bacterium]